MQIFRRKLIIIRMYEIDVAVLEEIRQKVYRPEMGGILGINENRIVTEFHFDNLGVTEDHRYIPNIITLNEIICIWQSKQVEFIGFVHSHPKGRNKLSLIDIDCAKRIKESTNMQEILMLLYIPEEEQYHQYVI